MRKEAGFSVEDRIDISMNLDGNIKNALIKFEGYFKAETLVINIVENLDIPDFIGDFKFQDRIFKIFMKKVKWE